MLAAQNSSEIKENDDAMTWDKTRKHSTIKHSAQMFGIQKYTHKTNSNVTKCKSGTLKPEHIEENQQWDK